MTNVAVVGAAGYAGIEAVRLVLAHDRLQLTLATSAADQGKLISDVYPALAGLTDLAFSLPDPGVIAAAADVALLAVPHTAALELVPPLLERGVRVIDMSADYRLQDAELYEAWYAAPHTSPELLAEAVFGLPELDRSRLLGARLVACPGCYPTATTLASLPALAAGVVTGDRIVVDAKSGVSGAGRSATATTHYVTVNEAIAPYKVAAHRHTPEIEQALSSAAGRQLAVVFAPHLVPMSRGLLSTVYMEVEPGFSAADAHELYCAHYADEPFVFVRPLGAMPSTAEVRGTNRASIGVAVDTHTNTLIAACAIDNLVKGAAGQAVQCLNAVLGYPEAEGLNRPAPIV
ncbi:MAG: N-acetyl-gamma-glutamyl-phosphate reductase [Coriobacteriia bacterium]